MEGATPAVIRSFFHRYITSGRSPGSGSADWLGDWINLDAIRTLAHHTSAVVAAVVLFWFVGFVVQRLLHEGTLRRCVLFVDEFTLLCLFIYFAYQLFIYL